MSTETKEITYDTDKLLPLISGINESLVGHKLGNGLSVLAAVVGGYVIEAEHVKPGVGGAMAFAMFRAKVDDYLTGAMGIQHCMEG